MEQDNENRSKWIKFRLKTSEIELINKRYKNTAFQNLSEFGRAMLLGKPVTVIQRDKSMDEVLEELILLRRELNFIGSNLNQVVRNINRAHGYTDQRLWVTLITTMNGKLLPCISKIKFRMDEYAGVWLQKLKAEKA